MGVLFKTALVGGFQKEEVIEYIEKLKNDWAEEERRLQEELRQTREEESAKALIAGILNHKFSIIIFQHNPVCLKFIQFSPLIW